MCVQIALCDIRHVLGLRGTSESPPATCFDACRLPATIYAASIASSVTIQRSCCLCFRSFWTSESLSQMFGFFSFTVIMWNRRGTFCRHLRGIEMLLLLSPLVGVCAMLVSCSLKLKVFPLINLSTVQIDGSQAHDQHIYQRLLRGFSQGEIAV